jgi:hypothetical protein
LQHGYGIEQSKNVLKVLSTELVSASFTNPRLRSEGNDENDEIMKNAGQYSRLSGRYLNL